MRGQGRRGMLSAVLVVGGVFLSGGCASAPSSGDEVSAVEQEVVVKSTVLDSELLPVGDSPILGNINAPITIIDFSSLQCPFCARGNETLKLVMEKYPDEVRIVSKSFPLGFQAQSVAAARAALAAGEQGKYWEMRDLLFDNMQRFRSVDMGQLSADLAGRLGLDVERFVQDLENPELDARISRDQELGVTLGVQGTPHYFINGVRISGAQPFQMFDVIIDRLLLEVEDMVASGVERDAVYREMVTRFYQPVVARAPVESVEPPVVLEADPRDLEVGDSYAKGPEDAPITIYEFASFQCPFCERGARTVREVMDAYPGKIRLVFKNFPLEFQPQSEAAGRAALAAGRQGKFWEMYDLIYAHQKDLGKDGIFDALAEQAGLDVERFRRDMEDPAIVSQVRSEHESGMKVGVRGTPTFFINGRVLTGAQPIEKFKEIIDAELVEE